MTTYWAQTLSLLLTVNFLLTFEQMLKVLKMPAPTIQVGAAELACIEGAGILSILSICSKVRRTITVRSKVNDCAQYVVTIYVIVM